MKKFQHPECNAVLGAPPGVPIEQVTALPIARIRYQDGTDSCISFWKPTPEELAMLNQGYVVSVELLGVTHPPMCVLVDSPDNLDRLLKSDN